MKRFLKRMGDKIPRHYEEIIVAKNESRIQSLHMGLWVIWYLPMAIWGVIRGPLQMIAFGIFTLFVGLIALIFTRAMLLALALGGRVSRKRASAA